MNTNNQKICFFHPHRHKIGGGLYYFYRLANELGVYFDTYIENRKHNQYNQIFNEKYNNINYKFVNYEDKNTIFDENTIFFTYLNMLPILWQKYGKLSKAKIFIIDFHPYSPEILASNLKIKITSKEIKDILGLFVKKNAIVFMDKSSIEDYNKISSVKAEEKYLPVFPNLEQIQVSIKPIINNKIINIGWLARLDNDKIHSLINLLDNLYNLKSDKKIKVHIIGDGNSKHKINKSYYSQKLELIFTSYLYGDELQEYLTNNIDLMVNFGIAALDTSILKIPTVIPILSMNKFDSNKYYFLFDTKNNILGCKQEILEMSDIQTYTLEEILDKVYQQNNKEMLGEKCYQYTLKYHNLKNTITNFIKFVPDTQLTFEDCLKFKSIKKVIKEFSLSKQLGNMFWDDYVFLKRNKAFKLKNKTRIKIWQYFNKKNNEKQIQYQEDCSNYFEKISFKIWHHYNKKLSKKGFINLAYLNGLKIARIKRNQHRLVEELREKYLQNKKIKVAFLHMYITSDQNVIIFDEMLKSDIFDPYWIVNPDVSRSQENFNFQYERTRTALINKYGVYRVLDGYNFDTNEFIDYTNDFDLVTTSTPYEKMAHKLFQVRTWAVKIPMFYISYFYMGRCYVTISNLQGEQFNYFWKIFSENNYVKKLAEEYQILKGENIIVTGYPKLDMFNNVEIKHRTRKKVILAPHHTIGENELYVGAFLSYYSDLVELPGKFPEIDFVYRPHPLLEENLNKLWGKDRYQEWLDSLLSQPNVTYSIEGDYQELFVNSDALVHDCGSFSAEYLCTGHPCAYWFKQTADYNKTHTELGHKCIDSHYLIKTKQDLFNFIENTVIKGIDPKKENRMKFAREEIMVNYPNATATIMEILTKEIIVKAEHNEKEQGVQV